ncbi:hypothetical protein AB0D57_19910 [Streptomyces sp. NPDC048275]|uniref:hypothetical protein n=1 Tax=Streptomyces sp. NPDC048275 TaxID=3155629 RepID=UPI0033F7047B
MTITLGTARVFFIRRRRKRRAPLKLPQINIEVDLLHRMAATPARPASNSWTAASIDDSGSVPALVVLSALRWSGRVCGRSREACHGRRRPYGGCAAEVLWSAVAG